MMQPRRKFEACAPLTGPLNGGLPDWPSHIQDAIFAAWAELEQVHGIHLELHHAVVEKDPDGYFARVGLVEKPRIALIGR